MSPDHIMLHCNMPRRLGIGLGCAEDERSTYVVRRRLVQYIHGQHAYCLGARCGNSDENGSRATGLKIEACFGGRHLR